MGTEGAWIPWVLGALSTGATLVDQEKMARKQDSILSRQIQANNERQAEADRKVAETLRERAASDGTAEREELGSQYLDAARAALGKANAGLGQVGKVSDAYTTSANDAAMGVADYGSRVANLMARIDAPARKLQKEGIGESRLRTELGLIGRAMEGDDFITRLKLQMVRPNLGLRAASALLGGAAMGAAGAGGAASGASGSGSLAGFGSEAADWYSNPALWRTG